MRPLLISTLLLSLMVPAAFAQDVPSPPVPPRPPFLVQPKEPFSWEVKFGEAAAKGSDPKEIVSATIEKANGLRHVRLIARDSTFLDYWLKGMQQFLRKSDSELIDLAVIDGVAGDYPEISSDYRNAGWITAENYVGSFKVDKKVFFEFVDPPSLAIADKSLDPIPSTSPVYRALIYADSRLPFSIQVPGEIARYRPLPPNPALSLPPEMNEVDVGNQKYLRENTVDTPAR